MPDIFLAKRVIDYVGLGARNIPERNLDLFKDLQPVLALLQGMTTDGAKLINVDANGNLQVSLQPTGGLSPQVALQLSQSTQNLADGGVIGDAGNAFQSALVSARIYNGASHDRVRSASAANLAALSGLGASLVTPPGQFSIQSSPATGSQASISRAAAGAGVRNVCTGFGFGFSAAVAPVATSMRIDLRDGATGAGTILKTWFFDFPAAVIAPFAIEVAGVEIPGSANTAMTMEWAGALANLREFVNLAGHIAS